MNRRDLQRLIKIDEEIYKLNLDYERMKQHEILTGKTHLLLSRGIKYRIDCSMRARKILAKAMATAPSMRTVHKHELAERKRRLDDAIAELPELEQHLAGAAAMLVNNNSADAKIAFKEAEFEVRRQKSRIAAYERSWKTFAKREDSIPEKLTRNVLPKAYKAEEDVTAIYGQLPIDSEIGGALRLEDTAIANTERWAPQVKSDPLAMLAQLGTQNKQSSKPTQGAGDTSVIRGGWFDTPIVDIKPTHERIVIDNG